MRISDWSSDVCSSDLADTDVVLDGRILGKPRDRDDALTMLASLSDREHEVYSAVAIVHDACEIVTLSVTCVRSEEHTSELQSLMRISYAVFCLKKKKE